MKPSSHRPKERTDQQGLVSIMITMVMMVVISLIVFGFFRVSQRNQREALDRQLSTQAFYAAETGVNDVAALFYSPTPPVVDAGSDTNCKQFINKYSLQTQLSTNVAYTCVLVDNHPPQLHFSSGSVQSGTVTPLNVDDNLTSLSFTWEGDDSGSSDPATCGDSGNQLPPASSWNCAYAIVRVDLVQMNAFGAAALVDNATTLFLLPNTTSDQNVTLNSFTDASKKSLISHAACDKNSRQCKVTVSFNGAASSKNYYARLTYLYKNAKNIVISGTTTSGTAHFSGAVAQIDVTGKAIDELRRIQVQIPLDREASNSLPLNAVQSTSSICKRFTILPGTSADPATLCQP